MLAASGRMEIRAICGNVARNCSRNPAPPSSPRYRLATAAAESIPWESGALEVRGGEAILTSSLRSLQIPDTVQAVIRSRIDRLAPDAREVLRYASVIGREFTRPVLERTLEHGSELSRSLESLKAMGLIQQLRILPEAAYQFKHVLTQEVAYESLLLHQRRVLHEKVGRALEELYADRVEEQLDLLAQHFGKAESWKKAVQYARRSADRARKLIQYREALRRLEQAHDWL